MKKRIRILLIVSFLSVLLLAAYFVLSAPDKQDNSEEQGQGEIIYIDRQASEVESLTYRIGGAEFSVVRSGTKYVLKEDENFPLDRTAVDYMTNAVARLVFERRINPEGSELDEFGLSSPNSIIEVIYTDGARLTLKVGDYNPYADAYYCSVGDSFVYLAGGDFVEAFEYTYSDLLLDEYAETPQYGFSSLTEIIITSGDKKITFTLADAENGVWEREGEEGDFYQEALLLYNELFGFYAEDWVSYNIKTEEQFALYGLEPAEIRILFKHTEIEEVEVNGSAVIKETERESAFLIGSAVSEESTEKRYFSYGGGSVIYVISESDLPYLFDTLE